MSTPVLKLLTILLLMGQAWMGFARGEAMCIRWGTCESHAEELPQVGGCDGHHDHDHDHHDTDHHHGPFANIELEQPACGCHVHIPASSDRPANPPDRVRLPHPASLFTPVVISLLTWDSVSPPHVAEVVPHPDCAISGRTRALCAARLLI